MKNTLTLNNGVECPALGIGTFMLSPADAENSVREALKMGYRLVDPAAAYQNERACGRGIRASGVARSDVFLSTKLWPSEYTNPRAVDETLERLGTDYVDLLYIHQPAGDWLAGYRQLEKALRDGKARSIGISNFEGRYLEELAAKWETVPQFMQVEAHPYFTQRELRTTLDRLGIRLMSWYPLGHGDKALLREPVLADIAARLGRTPAQVVLRWHVQMGFSVTTTTAPTSSSCSSPPGIRLTKKPNPPHQSKETPQWTTSKIAWNSRPSSTNTQPRATRTTRTATSTSSAPTSSSTSISGASSACRPATCRT